MAEERDPKPGTKPGKNTPGTTGTPKQGTNQPRQSEKRGRGNEDDTNMRDRRNQSENLDEGAE